MEYINLDADFNPFGKNTLGINKINFPSGCEPHIKIDSTDDKCFALTTRISSSDEIIRLLLTVDSLKRMGAVSVDLFIPYLPFARQDRVMVPGEPLSLKVTADLLNSCGFSKVRIYDPHSDVSLALINNSVAVNNHAFVSEILSQRNDDDYFIVSPDAGAYKKIFKVAQYVDYKGEIIMCNKLRDVSNGVIRSVTVSHDDLQGKDCYIIDDICDGGGTFTLLASVLRERNCRNIYLAVSHGLFTKGVELDGINHIYCTNSFKDIPNSTKLTQIPLRSGLLSV